MNNHSPLLTRLSAVISYCLLIIPQFFLQEYVIIALLSILGGFIATKVARIRYLFIVTLLMQVLSYTIFLVVAKVPLQLFVHLGLSFQLHPIAVAAIFVMISALNNATAAQLGASVALLYGVVKEKCSVDAYTLDR